MAPISEICGVIKRSLEPSEEAKLSSRLGLTVDGGFLEAWAQGYNVGSLIILILIVFCNYRSGIWLHKLILLELVLALWHGTFIFVKDPIYGWYLSSTALLLFISYQVHNIVSWLKIRPFLPKWGSYCSQYFTQFVVILLTYPYFYNYYVNGANVSPWPEGFLGSLIAVQPFWIAEAWSNFSYFNNLGSSANLRMRPWEALFRDPWWIFTTWKLIDIISKTYMFKVLHLIKVNPRFGVMLACMFISIAFLLTDVVINALRKSSLSGINPYWRFALVFKCASDTIFLDDFKSVLDNILAWKMHAAGGSVHRGSITGGRRRRLSAPHGLNGFGDLDYRHDDGSELIQGPKTTIFSSWRSPSKFLRPFTRRVRSIPISKMHAQKETTIATEMRKLKSDSFSNNVIPMPAPVMCGARLLDGGIDEDALVDHPRRGFT